MKASQRKALTLAVCFCLSILLSFAHSLSNIAVAQTQSVSVFDSRLDSQIAQAQELQSLGFYRRALLQLEALNLFDQPNSTLKIDGLHLLSDLQRTVGSLDAAKETIEAALATAQAVSTSLESQPLEAGQNDVRIAPLLLSLGHIAAASGEIEQALAQYERVDAIAPNPQVRLRSQLSKLLLLRDTSDDISDQAQIEALYSDIQTLIDSLGVDKLTVNARLELASYQIEDSRSNNSITPQSIAQNLATAQRQAHEISDSRAESYALGYLGELYLSQQQLTEAETVLERALEMAEALNAADLAYQWQWSLGRVHRQQDQIAQALANYENAAKNLETLRGDLIAVAPDLRFDFKEKVEPVYREWVDLLLNRQPTPADLTKAQLAIESLQLAELEDFFRAPCIPPSTDINQLIESTSSPTAVLYPIILSDRLEILLRLPGQPLQQYTVPIARTTLEGLLDQFQSDLRLPFTINRLQPLAARLYDLLIRPMQSVLERDRIDTLVFVLDGSLRNVPMSALYDGQRYLVEDYSIAIAPGLQMVDPQPLATEELTTLVAGLSEGRHGFSDLPFVKQEVSQIQQITNSRVLLNEDFTKVRFTELLNNNSHRVVHLATHGQFSADAEETFILAWDDPIKVDEFNALLRQSDQNFRQDRPNAIELLILSACETALGDRRAALGIAGVAVQAGARSTLATLWNLDDETGALFSDYFYQALQQPTFSKAQALRSAQLQLLRGEGTDESSYQHPRYWASYVLLGNWL
ncbi:MAG: CHAT domain-containing protein [Cyanobacteria bacterium P01_D01_bin.1]